MTSDKRRQRELRRIVNMALGHPPKKKPSAYCPGCTPDEDQPSPDPRAETPTEE